MTEAEGRVLKLTGQYKTSTEIAEELFISKRTVDRHRANIAEKLQLKGSHGVSSSPSTIKTICSNPAPHPTATTASAPLGTHRLAPAEWVFVPIKNGYLCRFTSCLRTYIIPPVSHSEFGKPLLQCR